MMLHLIAASGPIVILLHHIRLKCLLQEACSHPGRGTCGMRTKAKVLPWTRVLMRYTEGT